MIAMSCAGCGRAFEVGDDLSGRKLQCGRCGAVTRVPAAEIVLEPIPPVLPRAPKASPKRKKPRKRFDREGWLSLGVGIGLAVVSLWVPLMGMVIGCLATVIHELGHTATAWLFGYPALLAFDLTYGGGQSIATARQPVLILAVYGVFAFFLLRAWGDWPRLLMWAVLLALYSLAAFTVLHQVLMSGMGHGGELLFAGIFLYRALSGSQILRREERPLYAWLGLSMLAFTARFGFELTTSAEHREAYHEAHGGGHVMDFDVIADQYLACPLEKVSACYLLLCLLTPVATFLAYYYLKRSRSS
jgi:hypothetical protein